MQVFALWSAPRSRSTAFFRSMLQRGDVLALHEPLEGLHFIGPLAIGTQTFESAPELLAWLGDDKEDQAVFLKETVNRPVQNLVLDDRRLLAEVRHAFPVRRPEEIAASWYALERDMRIFDTGLELLHELFVAVQNAGGHPPVVVDSDDLVARPAATMAAYCAAVGLPFIEEALRWQRGERAEWGRSSCWHQDAAASTGFAPPEGPDRHRLASHPEVARFARRHRPFYEMLRDHRLDIDSGSPLRRSSGGEIADTT
ncbi:MAG: sulfotransferase family protein [Acidimicrobiales bacterium]